MEIEGTELEKEESDNFESHLFPKQQQSKTSPQPSYLFDNFNPIGFVFVDNNIFKGCYNQLLTQKVIQRFCSKKWCFYRLSSDLDFFNLAPLVKEAQIETFALINKDEDQSLEIRAQLIPILEQIRFPNLKVLDLYDSQISNCEFLGFLDTPSLQKLNLIYNDIHNFQSLAKNHFRNLNFLWVYSRGQIREQERQLQQLLLLVSRTRQQSDFDPIHFKKCVKLRRSSRWHMPNLTYMRLDKHDYNDIVEQDLSFLLKLENCGPKKIESHRFPDAAYMYGLNKIFLNSKRILNSKILKIFLSELFGVYSQTGQIISANPNQAGFGYRSFVEIYSQHQEYFHDLRL